MSECAQSATLSAQNEQELHHVGGEMEQRIAALDWAATPIGPRETWSPALKTMVRMLLANRFPMLLWWGPDYVSIYNDSYIPILGKKHPWGLGKPVRECWSEIWDILRPLIDTPFQGGPATWSDDIELHINRAGFTEETHFTVAYSPVPDEEAPRGIGGFSRQLSKSQNRLSVRAGVTLFVNWHRRRTPERRKKHAAMRQRHYLLMSKIFRSR